MGAAYGRRWHTIHVLGVFERGEPERDGPRATTHVDSIGVQPARLRPVVGQLLAGVEQFGALHVVHVGLEQFRVALVQFSVFLLEFGLAFLQPARVLHRVLVFEFEHADDALEGLETGGELLSFALRRTKFDRLNSYFVTNFTKLSFQRETKQNFCSSV